MAPRGCGHLPACLVGTLSSRGSSEADRQEWGTRSYSPLPCSYSPLPCSYSPFQKQLHPAQHYEQEEYIPPPTEAVNEASIYLQIQPRGRSRSRRVKLQHKKEEEPEAHQSLLPPIPEDPPLQQMARLDKLRKEMRGRKAVDLPSSLAIVGARAGGPSGRPLPKLPPVCGRSPPCSCPEDRELATRLRMRILRRISTLRRKHLRLRVTFLQRINPMWPQDNHSWTPNIMAAN